MVRVEGVFALELQHLAPVVIQRVNAHYGWACIGRIVMRQGRVDRRVAASLLPWSIPSAAAKWRSRWAPSSTMPCGTPLDRLGVAIVATAARR